MSVFQEINRKKANFFWHIIDIVSSIFFVSGRLYQDHIGCHYVEEAKRFDLDGAHNILHIGSGAYPITALVLADLFNCHIVTIDKNPIVLNIAEKVIKKRKLTERIHVLNGDGLSFDVSRFDVVIISSCSVPKEEILTHIFTHTSDDCKIIVRELSSETEKLKTFASSFQDMIQTDEMMSCAVPNLCWNSLLFKKKKMINS